MAEASQNYRKKQAVLCILVFVCLGLAFMGGSALIAVGMILLASAICFWAATTQPKPPEDEHHHH